MLARSNHEYFVRRGQYHADWDKLPKATTDMAIEAQAEIIAPLIDVLEAGNKLELASLQFAVDSVCTEMEQIFIDNESLIEARIKALWRCIERLRGLLPNPPRPEGDSS